MARQHACTAIMRDGHCIDVL